MQQRKYLADFSLALINRTGAYYISRDVRDSLVRYFPVTRFWRLRRARLPEGIFRKFLGRLMLKEIGWLGAAAALPWPDAYADGRRLPTVFFDPLYVLRARLIREDIVLCHDVGPISHQELSNAGNTRNYRAAYEKIKEARPGVVFVSEFSKREFQRFYGDDYRFLRAVPLYARPDTQKGEVAPVAGVTKPFLLTVAALERRKNYLRVMKAYAKAGLHEKGVTYVFCGPRGTGADEILAAAAATPGVIVLPYVQETELRWLYANAIGFVLPSLTEGFGLPALEAAGAGVVPLVSQASAQEEAIGGNGVLVDPYSVDSIAAGLEALLYMSDAERAALIARARAHAETLTFERFIGGWEEVLRCTGDHLENGQT
jgi:glycosyltransferase involved in cell wall biosynthesis